MNEDVTTVDQMIDSIIKKKEAEESLSDNVRVIMKDNNSDHMENSPWLRRTNWLRQFEGRDMNALIRLTIMTAENEG
jgi:hypothetical protein